LKLFEDPEEHVKNVLEECEFDFCRMKTEETICDYLSDFAETCINTHSIPVQYRAPNQCRESSFSLSVYFEIVPTQKKRGKTYFLTTSAVSC